MFLVAPHGHIPHPHSLLERQYPQYCRPEIRPISSTGNTADVSTGNTADLSTGNRGNIVDRKYARFSSQTHGRTTGGMYGTMGQCIRRTTGGSVARAVVCTKQHIDWRVRRGCRTVVPLFRQSAGWGDAVERICGECVVWACSLNATFTPISVDPQPIVHGDPSGRGFRPM